MLHPPFVPPGPPAEAGPSRRPLESPTSPARSNSLTHRQREKMPMPINVNTDHRNWARTPSYQPQPNHGFPTHPHTSGPRYDYHMATPPSPNSIRRSVSDEGGQRSRAYTEGYVRPPAIDPTQAALLHHVREKMSNQDQEAMRRLRETMAAQATSRPVLDPLSPTGDRFPPRMKMVVVEDGDVNGHGESMGEREDHGGDLNRTPRPPVTREPRVRQGSPFNIAVIGHPGVGKTTVILRANKAWGVSDPTTTVLSSGQRLCLYHSHVQPGGKLEEHREVEYIELDMSTLDLSPSSEKLWADEVPPISSVILCYDATRASTLDGISEALKRLALEGIPMIILACKSDPEAPSEIDAAYANSLGEAYNVGLIEVTALTSEGKSKMRNGLRWLLFKLEQRNRKSKPPSHLDLKQLSTSQPQPIQPQPPDIDLQSPAESEGEGHSSGGERIMWPKHGRGGGEASQKSSSGSLTWIMTAPVNVEEGAVALPNVGEQKHEEGGEVEDVDGVDIIPISQVPEAVVWLSLDELYRKVFSSIVTKENEHVVSSFFLTYRRFATPLDVMREFLIRFQDVSTAELDKDLKMVVLQRLIGALIDWACEYPGDVVDEEVQAVYREILAATLRYRYLSHLAAELVTIESQLLDVDDIDTSWSCGLTITSTTTDTGATSRSGSVTAVEDPPGNTDVTPTSVPKRATSYTSINLASSSALSLTGSSRSHSQDLKRTSFDLRRNASNPRLLGNVPSPNAPMSDFGFSKWRHAWEAFMGHDPRAFAVDLTKMQWSRFAMIRPRDVFRHDLGKERDGPVALSIEFFNHVSRWVTTMILANPKPKHRARTYERFILIAHHLRRLNNYDSLYAVMSGMRETSVHRLAQTHALVSVSGSAARDFEEHVGLMDPRGGYAEYSKAFELDMARGSSAIPLLTVILGQISRLQSARPADRREDGSIQWDKFLLFGQILSVISTCQQRGPTVPGEPSLAFHSLMENTNVITSEDALFERSRLLEPPNGTVTPQGQSGGVLKKLAKISIGVSGRDTDFVPYI